MTGEHVRTVVGAHARIDRFDGGPRGLFTESVGGRFHLATPHVLRAKQDLAVEVRHRDAVRVDEGEVADARGCEIGSCRATQAPGADDGDAGSLESLLTLSSKPAQGSLTNKGVTVH